MFRRVVRGEWATDVPDDLGGGIAIGARDLVCITIPSSSSSGETAREPPCGDDGLECRSAGWENAWFNLPCPLFSASVNIDLRDTKSGRLSTRRNMWFS